MENNPPFMATKMFCPAADGLPHPIVLIISIQVKWRTMIANFYASSNIIDHQNAIQKDSTVFKDEWVVQFCYFALLRPCLAWLSLALPFYQNIKKNK
jgi:hypothetical protein